MILKKKTKHECEYCKRFFLKPSDLKRHIRIHMGNLKNRMFKNSFR